MSRDSLFALGLTSIQSLESAEGILASGRTEAYGCIFGRDSLLSCLSLLRTYDKTKDPYFLQIVEKTLRTLCSLQGTITNIESGEEPGKIVHEYRPQGHEHLTQSRSDPWYLYPEGVMRNYDTVDATPLFLITVYEFSNYQSVAEFMPAVRAALAWVKSFDGFVTYAFSPDRKHGGLRVQSWMDSTESLFYETHDERPPYPIAPVEVQAYVWKALVVWGEDAKAAALKEKFNNAFVLKGPKSVTLAFALDGNGKQLTAPRSSMGHVLWAAHNGECILDSQYVHALRKRLLARDLFVPKAGIRTLSNRSLRYDPYSYHNGSIWPHDTAMLAEGLENFGFAADAKQVRAALLNVYTHFKTPLELYSYNRGLREYITPSGHKACRVQAWSAASLLSIL